MIPTFSHFAAIDWSGAKGSRHKGIALAVAEAGSAHAPQLVQPIKPWSRADIQQWIRTRIASGERWLIGMDFSFAPPFIERGCYLPEHNPLKDQYTPPAPKQPAPKWLTPERPDHNLPDNAQEFWAYVDALCQSDADLGATSFLETHYRRHFYFGAADGPKANFMHFRQCELQFNAQGGGKPSTIFDAIGAAQVAKASFAGMRLLHNLKDDACIWPFYNLQHNRSVIVEIYCRAFIRMAGLSGRKLRSTEDLNSALMTLGSEPVSNQLYNDHETDALIAAAGLRSIGHKSQYWQPSALNDAIARTEGWTFGVD